MKEQLRGIFVYFSLSFTLDNLIHLLLVTAFGGDFMYTRVVYYCLVASLFFAAGYPLYHEKGWIRPLIRVLRELHIISCLLLTLLLVLLLLQSLDRMPGIEPAHILIAAVIGIPAMVILLIAIQKYRLREGRRMTERLQDYQNRSREGDGL